MGLTIATNTASINTQKWLGVNNKGLNAALERLSSGFKINSASDDAAGSGISLRLNVKAVSVAKAIDNGNQATGMLSTAESGLTTISDILNRLKSLATQAASDTVSNRDRVYLDNEATKLKTVIDNITANTKYGVTSVLSTGATSFTFQLGDVKTNNQIVFTGTAITLGLTALGLTTQASSEAFQLTVDTAIDTVNSAKSAVGSTMNQVSFQLDNLNSVYQNTVSAVSTIKDADYVAEMANFTKYQILNQAGISMLSQANQLPQQILSLLK